MSIGNIPAILSQRILAGIILAGRMGVASHPSTRGALPGTQVGGQAACNQNWYVQQEMKSLETKMCIDK